jgi:hypothetical protein
MKYVYYIDGKKFTTDELSKIPWKEISPFDENTPAVENLKTGIKFWCEKGYIFHRLTGPVRIFSDGKYNFWLNNKYYDNVKEWIKDHPNPDLYFDAIGVFTETDKVLWFLQN